MHLVILIILGVSLRVLPFFISIPLAIYLIHQTAQIIEETTGILKYKTGLAGGLLQSLGTAFPDMVIGVVSAILSLQAATANDMVRSVNLAIIAAATTFGSNIYNIAFGIWCLFVQNLVNDTNQPKKLFFLFGGKVQPFSSHPKLPNHKEFNVAIDILTVLSFLTAAVALCMVIFGKASILIPNLTDSLYQLTRPLGFLILLATVLTLYIYRQGHHQEDSSEPSKYSSSSALKIWFDLLVAGGIILLAAESIVHNITFLSDTYHIPYVLTGVLTALVGCLGEILVVYNFTVNPKGRIADAVVGVAMDNIVTTAGACLVAVVGGIYLGGSSLITIFVAILFLNTLLIQQINKLKTSL